MIYYVGMHSDGSVVLFGNLQYAKNSDVPFTEMELDKLPEGSGILKTDLTKLWWEDNSPSLDQLRAEALARIDGCTSAAIYAGIDITPSTTRGKHHYSFTETAQKDISHMMTNISVGTETSFSYKADDEKLNKYSADEIKEISSALTHLGTVYTKYKEELVTWIGRETSDDILSTIKFGIKLPDDLMKYLTDYIVSLGIDPTPYSAMFTI